MSLEDALRNVTHLFLDTAPVIYSIEGHPRYHGVTDAIFDRIDEGVLHAVTSPITLAECLVAPFRLGSQSLQQDYFDLIVEGHYTLFVPIDHVSGRRAAELCAHYNLTLPDALQIATALEASCQAFLTNDTTLQRVTELRILAVDDLEP